MSYAIRKKCFHDFYSVVHERVEPRPEAVALPVLSAMPSKLFYTPLKKDSVAYAVSLAILGRIWHKTMSHTLYN